MCLQVLYTHNVQPFWTGMTELLKFCVLVNQEGLGNLRIDRLPILFLVKSLLKHDNFIRGIIKPGFPSPPMSHSINPEVVSMAWRRADGTPPTEVVEGSLKGCASAASSLLFLSGVHCVLESVAFAVPNEWYIKACHETVGRNFTVWLMNCAELQIFSH